MTMILQGQTALVTGAGRNIGRSIALKLAHNGADIAVAVHRDRNAAERVAQEIRALGRRADVFTADVDNRSACHDLVEQVAARLGSPAILVNNAGIRSRAALEDLSETQVRKIIDTNMLGPLWLMQAVVPAMKQQGYGRIVNITGVAIHYMMTGVSPVVASKAGLTGLTRTIAFEMATHGITVNAVAPGITNTIRRAGQGEITPEYQAKRIARIPMGRLGQTDDIAGATLYLVSPDSGFITGQTIHINGGMAMVG